MKLDFFEIIKVGEKTWKDVWLMVFLYNYLLSILEYTLLYLLIDDYELSFEIFESLLNNFIESLIQRY